MKQSTLIVFALLLLSQNLLAQSYTPQIETCPCVVKVDPALESHCGYLVVPENRNKPAGRRIKIPFFYVKKQGDTTKNVTLFTTGGPGYSTTANFDSIGAGHGFLQFGGFIAFDQRGTKKALPCLDCGEVDIAIKRSYKENLSKDSLMAEAVKRCRKRLAVDSGIDLSAYNTMESAADINDLRKALHIEALTLFGISYSGGLMLTVARNHPEGVRALILNSPLPGYVDYDEHALFNINEALEQLFSNCEADSTNPVYKDLRQQFHQYFTAISGKRFNLHYAEKGSTDSFMVTYTNNELLDAVINRMNTGQVKTVPFVMRELIKGNHETYVREIINDAFAGNQRLSGGMRYSVYCTEQIAYANKDLIKKQDTILPWLAGYPFNNVNHAICDCWKVKPEAAIAKTPVYSNIPALIAAGDIDPWCRPFYNRLIKRTMPNSQLLIVHNQGHTPALKVNGIDFVKAFMANPYGKLVAAKEVTVE
jgi:pimeloyl-ACP methyl ester carboxylesterase